MKLLPIEPQGLIFDLDGTLLDTEPLYTHAAQAVLDPYGHVFSLELKRRIMGGDSLLGAQITVDEFNLPMSPREFLDARNVHLERLFPDAEEIDGAGDFMQAASDEGIPLGLATSSHGKWSKIKIGNRRWNRLFRTTICGDHPDLRNSKPAPDIFLLCAELMQVDPATTIAFEDSRNGVSAAKAAGMTVIAIDSPYVAPGDLDEADLVVENFRKLI